MPQIPGGHGKQQFGIGLFVAAGIAGTVTTPPYWGQSSGENVVRQERVVYDQTSTPVFVPAPAAPIASKLDSAYGTTTVVTSRVVYDQTSAPVYILPAQTPSAFAYQPVDGARRQQRKVLPDGYAAPVTVPAPVASITSTLASAHSSATVVLSRVVYDQSAARPIFPPVVTGTPTSTLPLANSLTIVRTSVIVLGQTSTPVFPPVVTPTSVELRFVPDAPQPGFYRQRIKRAPLSSFVFAYPVDDLAADYTDPYVRAIRPKPKVLPEAIAQPPFQPAPPVTTPTPAILFDNVGPVKVTPLNRTAIRTDLQGVVWPPQDPLSLTGVPPVVEPPPIVTTPPGGVGVRVGRYKQLKLKKKLKRDECEELLAYLRSLPPAELQEEIEELASRPQIASLLALMPTAAPPPVSGKPADDDDDDDCIALLLEILNS